MSKYARRLAVSALLLTAVASFAVGGAAYADDPSVGQPAPAAQPDEYIGSSGTSTTPPSTSAHHTVRPDASTIGEDGEFLCHLHANTPAAAGGYEYISYGAYQQCEGDGWYSGEVCARLIGESHLGDIESTGGWKCKSGTAFTLSVQTETKCPSDPAFYYYTGAKVTDDDILGTQGGTAQSETELGSAMCA